MSRPELCACCRQMFANHRLAFAAAEMEVHEAKARLLAQNQLAAAQAQAAQRKLVCCRPLLIVTLRTCTSQISLLLLSRARR